MIKRFSLSLSVKSNWRSRFVTIVSLWMASFLLVSNAVADPYSYSGATGGTITNGTPLSIPITVTDSFTINDLNIGFAATHSYRGDINMTVTPPGGSQYMSDQYFLGATDPSTADQIGFWMSEGPTSGVEAYDSYFRVDCGDYMHWTTQENSSLATEDAIEMFKIQRAAFIINSRNGNAKTKAGAWDADAAVE